MAMCTLRYRVCYLVMLVAVICFSVDAQEHSTAAHQGEVLTLQQAITLALRDNEDVKNALLDVSRSTEAFAASRTRRLPSFNVEILGTQQLTPIDFTFEKGVFGTYQGIGPIPAENTKLSTPMQPTGLFTTRVTQPLSTLH